MKKTIKFKKLRSEAIIPKYQSDLASGFDLHSTDHVWIDAGGTMLICTGLACELPPNTELQIRPRSGLAYYSDIIVKNSPGTIDEDYKGEIKVMLKNTSQSKKYFHINPGDRIAQGVVAPVIRCKIEEVEELSITKRGSDGFGSTGK